MRWLARSLFLVLLVWSASPALRADDETTRVIVKFGSICCGPDGKAIAKLADVVSGYEKKIGQPISSKRVHWGLEGDFTQCFSLVELDGPTQEKFVSDVRAAVQSGAVKVEENVSCRGGWS